MIGPTELTYWLRCADAPTVSPARDIGRWMNLTEADVGQLTERSGHYRLRNLDREPVQVLCPGPQLTEIRWAHPYSRRFGAGGEVVVRATVAVAQPRGCWIGLMLSGTGADGAPLALAAPRIVKELLLDYKVLDAGQRVTPRVLRHDEPERGQQWQELSASPARRLPLLTLSGQLIQLRGMAQMAGAAHVGDSIRPLSEGTAAILRPPGQDPISLDAAQLSEDVVLMRRQLLWWVMANSGQDTPPDVDRVRVTSLLAGRR